MRVLSSVPFFVWLLAALTFLLCLGIPGGYSYPIALLFLSGVATVFFRHSGLSRTSHDYRLMLTWGGYTLLMVLFVYLDGWHVRELDRPARFLLAVPVLLLLLRQPLPAAPVLFYGVALGAILSCIVALYDRFSLGLVRAQGGENAIMFGDTAMLLGFMSATGLMLFYSKKQYWSCLLSFIAVLAGIAASFLSGSRGGWVAAPLIVLFLLWQSRELFSKRVLWAGLSVGFVAFIALVAIPQTGMQQRMHVAYSDLVQYQQGNSNTSIGLRLDMWKSAFYLAAESPIFGEGQYGSRAIRESLAENDLIHPNATKFDHLHNEYLTSLGFQGLLGLISLLAIYLVPLKLFISRANKYSDNWDVKPYALAGALIPMCYMDFALTQAMFSHNIGVMMYAFPIVIFWAALRWQEQYCLSAEMPK